MAAGEAGRLPVVNYTVGLAWPAPPQTHLYNFLEGSNSSVKRAPARKREGEAGEREEADAHRGKRGEDGGERTTGQDFARDGVSRLRAHANVQSGGAYTVLFPIY